MTLKSTLLLLGNRDHVVFHVFSTEEAQLYIRDKMESLPIWVQTKVQVRFYEPFFPINEWQRLFALCSTQRLFIADKLLDVERVLYLDTDSVLVAPLSHVWREFARFTQTQTVGMLYNSIFQKGWYDNHAIPYPPPHGYNAGIFLMDLSRIRESNWLHNLTMIMRLQRRERSNILGDQDILNEYFFYFPGTGFSMCACMCST